MSYKTLFLSVFLLSFCMAPQASASHPEWQEVSRLYTSSHPYRSHEDRKITIHQPGAHRLRVHFSNLDLEKRYDTLELYDKYDQRVAVYTGKYHNPFWSEEVEGDTLIIRFKSDGSVERFGFEIDRYAYEAGDDPLPPTTPTSWERVYQSQASRHPYRNHTEQKFMIRHRGAVRLRVHFSRLDVERNFDSVEIEDGYGNRTASYTGHYGSPFFSESVEGDTLTVILRSDHTGQRFGFEIDYYEYQAGFVPPDPLPLPPEEVISVNGMVDHDHGRFISVSFYGHTEGLYPTSGMARVSSSLTPSTIYGVHLDDQGFHTNVIHLPVGVLTTVEIILQSNDGRRFSTIGYARAKNPGFRGFSETRQIR